MVRTAILGLGNVAERIHLPACRALAEIDVVAASEPSEKRRQTMQRRFAVPAVYQDSHELLERERPELVLVGTPPDSHRELCLAALGAGADVVCEKPFMPTVEEADEVIQEAKRLGRWVAVNTQYRQMAIYRKTRECLERGDFGRAYFIQCWQQMFHPPEFEKLEWRARLQRSTLFEFGTHALDLVCYLFDSLPETLSAHVPRVRAEFRSDVLVQLSLGFPGERVATLAFNRVSHAPERYLEMRVDCEDASLRLSLGGVARAGVDLVRHQRGRRLRSRISFVRGGEARVEAGGRSWVLAKEPQMAFASATAELLKGFLERRNSGGEPTYSGVERAREILRIALSGYRAAASRETLSLRSGRLCIEEIPSQV